MITSWSVVALLATVPLIGCFDFSPFDRLDPGADGGAADLDGCFASCEDAKLEDASFQDVDLRGTDLQGATVQVSKTTYAVGEPVVVTFANGPGNANDWIALYQKGAVPSQMLPSADWSYVGADPARPHKPGAGLRSGTVTLDATSQNTVPMPGWPLLVGQWTAYFMVFGSWNWIASVDFEVR